LIFNEQVTNVYALIIKKKLENIRGTEKIEKQEIKEGNNADTRTKPSITNYRPRHI